MAINAYSTTINVPADHSTIQAAINAASAGDIIQVAAGTYTENVLVNKRLTISGSGSSTIISSAAGTTPVMTISASGANASDRLVISNLKVTGATGGENPGAGILVQTTTPAGYYTFLNVESSSNQGCGIAFNNTASVTDVSIDNCLFNGNGFGIRIATAVPSFDGLNVYNSNVTNNKSAGFTYNPSGTLTNVGTNFTFTDCSFYNNSQAGVSNQHDLSFFGFHGNATLTNVAIVCSDGPSTTHKAHGLVFTNASSYTPSGNITLNGVSVSGVVFKSAITFQYYNDVNNISLSNVDIKNCIAPWGQLTVDHQDSDPLNIGNTSLKSIGVWNSGGINATSANFFDVVGNPLNKSVLADCFTIENQIGHKIDLLSLGFVTVNANNDYVTTSGSPSIQRAIDAASNGWTVNVAPGTYEEQVEITKDINLLGAGSTTIIKSPMSLTKNFSVSGGPINKPVVYIHDVAYPSVKNLVIDGAGRGNGNYRMQGVGFRDAGGKLENLEIKDIRETPISGSQHGVGVYSYNDNGTNRNIDVINCTIHDFQKNGIALLGANTIGNVNGCTITGAGAVDFIAQNGIQFGWGSSGTVQNNTVSGFSYTPFTYVSCGILLYNNISGSNMIAKNNNVSASQVGIYTINYNAIVENNTVNSTNPSILTAYWGIICDPAQDFSKLSPFDGLLNITKQSDEHPLANLNFVVNNNILTGDLTPGSTGLDFYSETDNLNIIANYNKITAFDYGVNFAVKFAGAISSAKLNYNFIYGNNHGMFNATTTLANAKYNWWGSCSGPYDISVFNPAGDNNTTGTGNDVSDYIDYKPWIGTMGSDMALWLMGSTLPGVNGTAVPVWQDYANCNGLVATAPNVPKEPKLALPGILTEPAVEFTRESAYGTSDILTIPQNDLLTTDVTTEWTPSAGEKTLFVVFKPKTAPTKEYYSFDGKQCIVEFGGPLSGFNIYLHNGYIIFGMWNRFERKYVQYTESPETGTFNIYPFNPDKYYVAKLEYNGTNFTCSLYDNAGGTIVSSPVEPFKGISKDGSDVSGIGGAARTSYHNYNTGETYSDNFNGFIGDVMLFNKKLSNTDLNLVQGYFNARYGFSIAPLAKQNAQDWIVFDQSNFSGKNELTAAYPNPFDAKTSFTFNLVDAGNVAVELFDAQGQKVKTMFAGQLGAGVHEFTIEGQDLNSGLYMFRVTGDNFSESGKVILSK
jgi:hypothetical protein